MVETLSTDEPVRDSEPIVDKGGGYRLLICEGRTNEEFDVPTEDDDVEGAELDDIRYAFVKSGSILKSSKNKNSYIATGDNTCKCSHYSTFLKH